MFIYWIQAFSVFLNKVLWVIYAAVYAHAAYEPHPNYDVDSIIRICIIVAANRSRDI
jgi:hypothetical protein